MQVLTSILPTIAFLRRVAQAVCCPRELRVASRATRLSLILATCLVSANRVRGELVSLRLSDQSSLSYGTTQPDPLGGFMRYALSKLTPEEQAEALLSLGFTSLPPLPTETTQSIDLRGTIDIDLNRGPQGTSFQVQQAHITGSGSLTLEWDVGFLGSMQGHFTIPSFSFPGPMIAADPDPQSLRPWTSTDPVYATPPHGFSPVQTVEEDGSFDVARLNWKMDQGFVNTEAEGALGSLLEPLTVDLAVLPMAITQYDWYEIHIGFGPRRFPLHGVLDGRQLEDGTTLLTMALPFQLVASILLPNSTLPASSRRISGTIVATGVTTLDVPRNQIIALPEPSAVVLMGVALVALLGIAGRQMRRSSGG